MKKINKILFWIKCLKDRSKLSYNKKLKKHCHVNNRRYIILQETRFPHPIGIIIEKGVNIGKSCSIYQNVTLGSKGKTQNSPTLGNNVTIYANSVVIGKINIGNNSTIGAGSIVLKDIPEGEVWAGNPAKFIRKIKRKKT